MTSKQNSAILAQQEPLPGQQPAPVPDGGAHRLRWWRTVPPDLFTPDDRRALAAILSATAIIGEPDWADARRGGVASAIGIALSMIPIVSVSASHVVDLAMSAVLLCALDGNAAAAHVMVHALRTLPGVRELAAQWREVGGTRPGHRGRPGPA